MATTLLPVVPAPSPRAASAGLPVEVVQDWVERRRPLLVALVGRLALLATPQRDRSMALLVVRVSSLPVVPPQAWPIPEVPVLAVEAVEASTARLVLVRLVVPGAVRLVVVRAALLVAMVLLVPVVVSLSLVLVAVAQAAAGSVALAALVVGQAAAVEVEGQQPVQVVVVRVVMATPSSRSCEP